MTREVAHLKLVETVRHLPVQTVYYRGKEVVKKNRAGKPLHATALCLEHMRRNDYEATVAEVYDTETGKLYAVMTNTVEGTFRVVFQAPLDKKKGQ